MYNKLFTKILDSSIWLEADHTRLVWITFLAVMDQDGVVALSSVGNVANRARVSEEQAEDAVRRLESPDDKNPDQEHEGRRIERIPGTGWFVINSEKYKKIVRAEDIRASNRERKRRSRAFGPADVTISHADVTLGHETVTPSETDTEEDKEKKKNKRGAKKVFAPPPSNLSRAQAMMSQEVTDDRKNHPAIVAMHAVLGIYPPKEIWDEIIDRLGTDIDAVRLKKTYTTWRARGYNKMNLDGVIDWYHEGTPKLGGGHNATNRKHSNGNGRQTSTERLRDTAEIYDKYPSETDTEA